MSELSYFRQRFIHRVFESLIVKFAERAEHCDLKKSRIAKMLKKDAGQINRILAFPSNMTLETLSDLALALGCEPDIELGDFDIPKNYNYAHPWLEKYISSQSVNAKPKRSRVTRLSGLSVQNFEKLDAGSVR